MKAFELKSVVLALPVAVFIWQVVGAARIFRSVGGDRDSSLSVLISLGFWALLIGGSPELHVGLVVPALLGLAGAFVLFEWARRTIHGQFFSWIFSADAPTFVCTRGPYAYIRNPFYTSYLMTMASTALMMPTLFRGVVVLAMVVYFSAAAVHEERKFESSTVAREYQAYKRRTGRFVPKVDALIAALRSPRV